MPPQPDNSPDPFPLARAWSQVAWVAAAFCAGVAGVLLWLHVSAIPNNPWESEELRALQAQLAASPKDEAIKTQIRQSDKELRGKVFRRLAMNRTGGWMLLAGAAVLFLAARRAQTLRAAPALARVAAVAAGESPPRFEESVPQTLDAARARRTVAGLGALVAAGFVAALLLQTPQKSSVPAANTASPPQTANETLPSLAEFRANWPRFRGPDGDGVSTSAQAPLSWSETAGVLWKSPVDKPGFNSPIVWGGRIFFSGGDAAKRCVYAYSTVDGKLLWERAIENVPGSPAKQPDIPEMTGFAASTMATDGLRVYVLFANGDLAALTLEGAPVWSKNLGVPYNQYGHAASLAIWKGRLIVQMDQGSDEPAGSHLLALEGATGKVVWDTPRQSSATWASPVVGEAAGKTQIITAGLPSVISYDFETGKELWRADVLEGELTPSPLLADGMVYAASPGTKLTAIKADGAGDASATHVAWSTEENVPEISSPTWASTAEGPLFFMVSDAGMVTALDAKSGEKIWEHDLATEVQASPVVAGGRLYIVATDGHAWVLEAGRQYKELGRGELDDKFHASPAFANPAQEKTPRLFLRGSKSLYGLGEKP